MRNYLNNFMTNSKTKNINLFFGEDDFTIAEEMKKEKENFKKEFKNAEIVEIDWNNESLGETEKMTRLQDGLLANSLFSSDKLLIIKNLLFSKNVSRPNPLPRREESVSSPDKGEENTLSGESVPPPDKGGLGGVVQRTNNKEKIILRYLENPQEDIKIFFVEDNLDKRKKTYKEIFKLEKSNQAGIKEFLTPTNFQFDNWIKKTVEKAGGKIGGGTVNTLAISLGKGIAQKDKNKKIKQAYNLWEANNEIEKLVSYCDDKEITGSDIKLLIKSKVDLNIFNLIDKISSKNKSGAVSLLNKQIDEGANEIYLLTMFVYQFRNLLKVKSLLNEGASSFEIASKTKLHPFVIQKSIAQCEKFEMDDLKKIYKKLFDADIAIKTGKMNPRLILDLIVVAV